MHEMSVADLCRSPVAVDEMVVTHLSKHALHDRFGTVGIIGLTGTV